MDPGPVEQAVTGFEPEDHGRLRKRLRLTCCPGQDGRLDEVRVGRPAGPRVDEVMGRAAITLPAMDARPGGRESEPVVIATGSAAAPGQSQDREVMRRKTRIGHAEEPGLTRIQSDRHIPIGIHDGGGVAVDPVERPVGQPPLADAVEVESETDRTADDGAAGSTIE